MDTNNQDKNRQVSDLTELRGLIERSGGLEEVKLILSKHTTKQIREALSIIIEGENHITCAIRKGRQKIATELIIRSVLERDVWPHNYEEFSWIKLFEFCDNRESIQQMYDKMKFAEPFAKSGLINLEQLVAHPKFFKVAVQLGARPKLYMKYNKYATEQRLGQLVLEQGAKGRELFLWLIQSRICDKFPLDREAIFWRITNGHGILIKALNRHPNWLLEQDASGDNILHFFLKRKLRKCYGPTWANLISGIEDRDALINAAIQRNNDGRIPALLYFERKISDRRIYPKEFLIGLRRLIESGQLDPLQKFITSEMRRPKIRLNRTITMVLFYLMQYGLDLSQVWREMQYQTQLGDFPFQNLFHTKCLGETRKPNQITNDFTEISAKKVIDADQIKYCLLMELPQELLHMILSYLSLEDVCILFSTNKEFKALFNGLLKSNSLWQRYFRTPFVQPKNQIPISQRITLRSNWFRNKYTTIKLPYKCTAVAMDENWLVLHKDGYYQYWNCQTKELTISPVATQRWNTRTLLSNYNNDPGPTILDSTYWRLIRGNEEFELKNNEIRDFTSSRTGLTPIDHRVLFSTSTGHMVLYDVQKDTIVYEYRSQHIDGPVSTIYNPYSGLVTLYENNTGRRKILDLRCQEMVVKDDSDTTARVPILSNYVFTDEHMAFFAHPGISLVDMNTMRVKYRAANIFGNSPLLTNDRAIGMPYYAPIMTQWNLHSQKIEWMELLEDNFQPVAANLRYLVFHDITSLYGLGSDICIRDYLS